MSSTGMELATETENKQSQQVNAKYLDICRNTNNKERCAEINGLWNGLSNVEQAEWIWNHKFENDQTIYTYFANLVNSNVIDNPNDTLQLEIINEIKARIYYKYCLAYLTLTQSARHELASLADNHKSDKNLNKTLKLLYDKRRNFLNEQFKLIVELETTAFDLTVISKARKEAASEGLGGLANISGISALSTKSGESIEELTAKVENLGLAVAVTEEQTDEQREEEKHEEKSIQLSNDETTGARE